MILFKIQQKNKPTYSQLQGPRTKQTLDDDLPDLKDKDVQDAATKIQAAFKGHKIRQSKMSAEVKKATVFKGPRNGICLPTSELPNLVSPFTSNLLDR